MVESALLPSRQSRTRIRGCPRARLVRKRARRACTRWCSCIYSGIYKILPQSFSFFFSFFTNFYYFSTSTAHEPRPPPTKHHHHPHIQHRVLYAAILKETGWQRLDLPAGKGRRDHKHNVRSPSARGAFSRQQCSGR